MTKYSNSTKRVLVISRFLVAILFFVLPAAKAQFVAYNDHAPGAGTAVNTTTWNVFGDSPGSTGVLKDIKTGATLPVTLTITRTQTGVGGASSQGSPSSNTPLYVTFNSFVDFQGSPNASVELSGSGQVTYTFTGLNPNKRYSLKGSAVRGIENYTDRWTLFEITGASTFTSAHSANVLTSKHVSSLTPNQSAIASSFARSPSMENTPSVITTRILLSMYC